MLVGRIADPEQLRRLRNRSARRSGGEAGLQKVSTSATAPNCVSVVKSTRDQTQIVVAQPLPLTNVPLHGTFRSVIRSFVDKETAAIFSGRAVRSFPHQIQVRARAKLLLIDAAKRLSDLRVPPSNHLEALGGDRTGQHSIRINRQWRICFRWQDGDAWSVEIADYH